MPKMKTHKGAKKRFRITATGKLKRKQAGKKHLLSHKTGKRKRHLRGTRYSEFISGLQRSLVELDRKTLADLAVNDPDTFTKLVELARSAK